MTTKEASRNKTTNIPEILNIKKELASKSQTALNQIKYLINILEVYQSHHI